MRSPLFIPAMVLSSFVVVACQDQTSSLSPLSLDRPSEVASDVDRAGPGALSVATWNVYYGANLDALLQPSPLPLPVQVAQLFGQVQATRADERAAAMATLLAEAPPDLIGLQEVARYRTQSPGDFLDGLGNIQNPVPNATTDVFDFVTLLRAALLAEGLEYVEAARTHTFDVELPVFTGGPCPPCDDLRLSESVAILARADLDVSNAQGALFSVNLPVSVAGFDLEILKGWASVDATVKGKTYRFLTTHLEPADIGPDHTVIPQVEQIQLAQAAEVLAELAGAEVPVVLAGDLNSEPDGGSTATYGVLADAGFVDAWTVGRPRGAGFTADQEADLLNGASALWHRIDFVLYRDDRTLETGRFHGAVHADRLGEAQADRTPSGLWPSDHAAVWVELKPPPLVGGR